MEKVPTRIRTEIDNLMKRGNGIMCTKNYRELMRIISRDIHMKIPNPGGKALEAAAQSICSDLPFLKLGGEYTSKDHIAVASSLKQRVVDLNRGAVRSPPNKRKSVSCATQSQPISKKEQNDMNLVLEDLRKSFDSEITAPPQDVAEKMVQTFAVQRILINSVNDDGKPLPVTSIREKIPYLFEEMNLVKHFEMLTATRVDQIYKKIEDNRLVLTKYLQSLTENARVLEVVQALAQQFKETTESFIILRDVSILFIWVFLRFRKC